MLIRRAREEEASSLTRIAREAKASWGYPDRWLEEWEPVLTFSTEYIRLNTVYVAELAGVAVGVAALEESEGEAELGHLWVLPDFHGAGVGKALLSAVAKLARERGWLALRIESDPKARTFYERLGAIPSGEVAAPVDGVPRALPVLRLPLTR